MWSAGSVARSLQCETWDHQSSRSATSESLQHSLDRLRRLKKIKAVTTPILGRAVFPKPREQPPHHVLPQNFDSCTYSRRSSPREALGLSQSTQQISRAIRSSPMSAEKNNRRRRRSGAGACRRSPRMVATGCSLTPFRRSPYRYLFRLIKHIFSTKSNRIQFDFFFV